MSHLLAIDPGIDLTGWAVYRLPPRGKLPTFAMVEGAFVRSGSLRTEAKTPQAERLASLATEIGEVARIGLVSVAIMEVPPTSKAYARNKNRARLKADGTPTGLSEAHAIHDTLQLMHRATGAMMASLAGAGVRVVLQQADTLKKKPRREWLDAYVPALLAGRRTNEDERDAVYLGARMLLNASRRWE